jgi:hypothetical protein
MGVVADLLGGFTLNIVEVDNCCHIFCGAVMNVAIKLDWDSKD